jgi:hypothetical protein
MKRFMVSLLLAAQIAFAQDRAQAASPPPAAAAEPMAIPFTLETYLIGGRNATPQYERVELRISEATINEGTKDQKFVSSWEITLIKKNGEIEKIKLEQYENLGRGHSVFRKVTLTEGKMVSGGELFAYIPAFTNTIKIDLCLKTNEHTRRRVILKPSPPHRPNVSRETLAGQQLNYFYSSVKARLAFFWL